MFGCNKGHWRAWWVAQRINDRLAVKALPCKEYGVQIGIEFSSLLTAAIEALRYSRHRTMHRLATPTMDPRTAKQQRKLAAPKALKSIVRILCENTEQHRRPLVPENLQCRLVSEDEVHGFEFSLLAANARSFGAWAPPPDRRHSP